MKTLVLGIGNTLLGDDGAGIEVIRRVAASTDDQDICFKETGAAGLNLLDLIMDFDRLIVVDACLSPKEQIGGVYDFNLEKSKPGEYPISLHSCGLAAAVELGRQLYQNERLPADIAVLAIGIHPVEIVTEELTPEVERAIPGLVELVREKISKVPLPGPAN